MTAGRRSHSATLLVAIAVCAVVTGLVLIRPADTVVDPVTQVGWIMDAPASPAPEPPATPADSRASTMAQPDPSWVSTMARRTGIGVTALAAYARAELRLAGDDPRCRLSWATLAGVGYVESHHGTIGGRVLGHDGRPGVAPIFGVALSGDGAVALVADTDDGRLDGDSRYDRAVGPMQFVPRTWATWSSDGDGDASADPQDIDDAAYAAARYLCSSGGRLDTPDAWTRAVLSYNPSASYLHDVLSAANTYAARARP